ncbi:MAG: ABC transporter substrate-binding protein, partial [Candidatus Nitrosocosmicus sp.]|nr:ABC transporter substrate-binding protein [Candidatus Nitrosocosmicus sp.]
MNSKVKLGISFAIILGVIVSSNPNFNWSFLSGQDPNPDKTVSQDNSLESETLNLGFFPNLNHAQVIIGIGNGNFNKSLTSNEEHKNITFNPHVFSSGPSLMNALYSGQLDVAYVGPDSIIDGYILFGGNEFRIISGASSGGASFVVRNDLGIETVDDLGGKKFATPQL